jgi:hypothetical protein
LTIIDIVAIFYFMKGNRGVEGVFEENFLSLTFKVVFCVHYYHCLACGWFSIEMLKPVAFSLVTSCVVDGLLKHIFDTRQKGDELLKVKYHTLEMLGGFPFFCMTFHVSFHVAIIVYIYIKIMCFCYS